MDAQPCIIGHEVGRLITLPWMCGTIEGLLVVGREHWVEVDLAVGLAASIVWGGRPVERERVQEAMGEVFWGVGLVHH